jgi:hypothetical protein
MEEGDNWRNRLTHASMETTDVKPLILNGYKSKNVGKMNESLVDYK